MKSSLNIPIAALCMSFGHISLLHAGNSVAEFDQKEAKSLDWRVVNDGVMGGLSKGQLNVSKDGILNFKGNLSLENNGGFSSIRTEKVSMDFSDADGFKARVKGDGRTYQLRFNTDARFRGMEVSFMAEFPTKKDSWTEVKIPFSDFTGSFRGMKLRKETFDPSKISRVGLLLADKKSGPFELNVDWIRTYGAGDSNSGGSDIVSLALADGRFGTLATALTKAGLVETLQGDGPFTVFAPTDKAFSALPKGTVESLLKPENKEKLQSILKYHVIGGSIDLASALKAGKAKTLLGESASIAFKSGQVKVNDAALIDADIEASNGVIHVIDSVILPPKPSNDIASVAKRAGNFKTLLAAIDAAGLSKALAGEGPLTILAPTDEAFKKLPKGTVQSLLKSENRDQLQAILALHAIPGKISAGDALNAGKSKAMGGALEFGIEKGLFKVNGATILKTDIECDNGFIHVIDTVILPKKGDGWKKSKTKTAMNPIERIEKAIDRGVPVFNSGDHAKCAAIYREALSALCKDKKMDSKITKAISEILERADKTDSVTTRAWLLRSGLDNAYSEITRR